ncbi:hypothetical protein JD844_017728 [Phrynosoma platyrhinos]|uniref:Uncharacterized protein n=1 Tax=Phrynosoma platyrhinos TaxID=52577 RepID=A0ABQ7SMD8_PHRPL|nr:hypothetical protein JD844_017728 [Phrynosoma platyrhinos]
MDKDDREEEEYMYNYEKEGRNEKKERDEDACLGETRMQLTAERLGIPLCQIVPVKNYSSELDLKDDVDILILMAVRQMLRTAESYLDDFPLEKNSMVD